MIRLSILFVFVFASVRVANAETVILINDKWNESAVRINCKGYKCERAIQDLSAFQMVLSSRFAASAECSGARVLLSTGKAWKDIKIKEYFELTFNFTSEAKEQNWILLDHPSLQGYNGEGVASDIAKEVCTIALKRGAKVD